MAGEKRVLQFFQVDTFTRKQFYGNPAAVCPLDSWLPDIVMQQIAAENNLSETAFFVKKNDSYEIRWFTPACEVTLCGHATLAAAFVLARYFQPNLTRVTFESLSGRLSVDMKDDHLTLDFPAYKVVACAPHQWPFQTAKHDEQFFGQISGTDAYLAVLPNAQSVHGFSPDFADLERTRADLIVTAKGDDVDFVSRLFAPWAGIPEDPVTGSAHCLLAPFWAARLGKSRLTAKQLSRRGGDLLCELRDDRVTIGGHAVLTIRGELFLDY